jgi:geranylgeranyl pyrophosphate synthase
MDARMDSPRSESDPWLAAFERRLAEALAGDDALDEVMRHLALAPAAKRIRPRFARLCADLAGADPAAIIDDAVAVELIHAASLLHDDVVDHAATRRGRPSANARFGDDRAVLAGDALLARALTLCSPAFVPHAAAAVDRMARAALLEVTLRGRADATPEQCLAIADGKTAALFSLAARAGSPDLAAAGFALGRAFQIADDVHDLAVPNEDAGAAHPKEDPANDLVERTPTLPLALLSAALREELAALWLRDGTSDAPVPGEHTAEVRALAARIAGSDAIAEAMRRARAEIDVFEQELAPFNDRPACATLRALARTVVA